MKRLRQTLTVLCLILSLATAALWVRSAWRHDRVQYRHTTLTAADALGWKGKVGVIEPGAWGDLVGVQGDPLSDVTVLEKPVFVMKGGEVAKR